MSTVRVAVCIPALLLSGCASMTPMTTRPSAPQPADGELVRIRAAVEEALQCQNGCSPFVRGVRLLSITREGDTIALNFSNQLLAAGTGGVFEEEMHRLLTAASAARTNPRPRVEDYRILIDGVPLDALR